MVTWFDDSNSEDSSDDLPWAKDYVKTGVTLREYYTIGEIYPSDKGLLLLANKFKAFVFKREKAYGYITEALDVWLEDHTMRSHLVVRLTPAGKVIVGLDEENDLCYWVMEGNKYHRKSSTGDGATSPPTPNPLLPPVTESPGVHQATTRGVKASQTKRTSSSL